MTKLKSSPGKSSRKGAAGEPDSADANFPSHRNLIFLGMVALSLALFWGPLRTLVEYSMRGEHQYDQYSLTILIPFLSAALFYVGRRKIFANVRYGVSAGAVLLLNALVADWAGQRAAGTLGPENALSIAILGLVLFWMGALALCYGGRALRTGLFPMLFLLLTIPLPSALLNGPVTFVQHGSADVASAVFTIFGAPVLRNGLVFALPELSIEVAKECSGIHSILALFIVSLLAGYFTGLALWKRVTLLALVFPIVCLTNGLRIGALALLSNYVNPEIIHSSLHRDGGFLFFGMAMVVLLGVVYLLGMPKRNPARAAASAALPAEK